MNVRVIFSLLLISAVSVMQLQAAGKRYAIVIGVKKYRATQPLPELPYTENDANDLAAVLKSGGYRVTLMTQAEGRVEGKENLEPQSAFIRDQLDALLADPFLKEDDIVIVALAGHGVQYEHAEDGRKTPKFYFCPVDADVANVKTANEITERNRLLDLAELYVSLNDCKAGGKLLLVDACRNDPSKPAVSRALASATLPPLPPPPGGIAAFFSCSANQRAFEDKDLKHGVFFHHVIEGLKGDADAGTAKRPADGKISLAELSENVCGETYNYVREKFQGARQAPELKGEFRLSIPLIEISGRIALASDEKAPRSTTAPKLEDTSKSAAVSPANDGSGTAATSERAKLRVAIDHLQALKEKAPKSDQIKLQLEIDSLTKNLKDLETPTGRREALQKTEDGQIFKVSLKGFDVLCKDERTGNPAWSRPTKAMPVDVSIVNSRVVVIDADDNRSEFDLQKGTLLLEEKLPKKKIVPRKTQSVKSLMDGARLDISANEKTLRCIHETKGQIWSTPCEKDIESFSVIDLDGTVIVIYVDDSKQEFDLNTGMPLNSAT